MKSLPPDDDLPSGPSKSQRKRDSTALQELGEQLTEAKPSVLVKCQLPEKLMSAIEEYQALPNKHGAQRRQIQFIGKLMRLLDEETLDRIHAQLNRNVEMEKRRFQRVEELRDRLVAGDNSVLTEVLTAHPQLDAQIVGQLVRQARKEQEQNEAPASSRKLFRLLREKLSS